GGGGGGGGAGGGGSGCCPPAGGAGRGLPGGGAPPPRLAEPDVQGQPTRERWRVLAWLCSLSALAYVDRICIMQVRESIELDLGLRPALTAYAFSAFSLAYALL